MIDAEIAWWQAFLLPGVDPDWYTFFAWLIPPAWYERAACAGYPTSWSFPRRGTAERNTRTQACEICAGYPVRRDCLRVALADRYALGIWAGTTRAERLHAHARGLGVDDVLAELDGTARGVA